MNELKLGLLPLDSRWISYSSPQSLANLKGVNVHTIDREQLGYFKKPSNYSKIEKWIENNYVSWESFIVSIEQLVYGGLIQSRLHSISLAEAKNRLIILEKIKSNKPQLKIFASNVLMRTSISTVSKESQKWWELINEYSIIKYQISKRNDDEVKKRLNEIIDIVPNSVLEEFLVVRNRNHEINKQVISLVKDGVIDFLLISQEDCSEEGIQLIEQLVLTDYIEELNLSERVVVSNGTDEATSLLVARCLNKEKSNLNVEWFYDNRNFVANYEDRKFSQNLEAQLNVLALKESEKSKDILLILPPKRKQGDIYPAQTMDLEYTSSELDAFISRVIELIEKKYNVYLLDIQFSNGGSYKFMLKLSQKMNLDKLSGYSAWNTASNSLGTILSQIALTNTNSIGNRLFTIERIIDDCFYQSNLREKIETELKKYNFDVWNINNINKANDIVNSMLESHQSEIQSLFEQRVDFSLKLYWPRTFEIDIINKTEVNYE